MPDPSTVAAINATEATARPSQVSTAAMLIGISLALGVANSALFMPRLPGAEAVVVGIITAAVLGGLAYITWLGRNWARITFTVFYVVGLPFYAPFLTSVFRFSLVAGYICLSQALLQLLAIYLLFTDPGRGWFQAKRPVA